jgi:3-isopropylmalate dehydrogenase
MRRRGFPDVQQPCSSTRCRDPATPCDFDVVVAENMFGDIHRRRSVLTASLGMLSSASLGAARNGLGGAVGLQPVHGTA